MGRATFDTMSEFGTSLPSAKVASCPQLAEAGRTATKDESPGLTPKRSLSKSYEAAPQNDPQRPSEACSSQMSLARS